MWVSLEARERELSRRDLLRAFAFGTAATGLAACGLSATPAPSTGASARGSAAVPSGSVAAATSSGAPVSLPTPDLSLTIREKIGQLLVVGFRGQKVPRTSALGRAIAVGELGGVILFDRNIASPAQVQDLCAGLTALAPDGIPLLIAIDQEGGRVTRLGPTHGFPSVPSEKTVGAHDTAFATAVYDRMSATLSDAGINLNLAPVVDVDVNSANPAIGALGRSFSVDPAVVTAMARASIRAHREHAVLTTLKHFPGLGSAGGNTDVSVVDVTKTWSEGELQPFRDLVISGADCVMVGHAINRNLDAKHPASLSKTIVNGLLRADVGWHGPVITDDLQAAAITKRYRRVDAIAAALNAGVDLLLLGSPSSDPAFYPALVDSIVKLVDAGTVDEARIDEAIARVALLRAQI